MAAVHVPAINTGCLWAYQRLAESWSRHSTAACGHSTASNRASQV